MFKPIQAEDEAGLRWVVFPDDPAWPFVHALRTRGVEYIVLPRTAYIWGELGARPSLPASLCGSDPSAGDDSVGGTANFPPRQPPTGATAQSRLDITNPSIVTYVQRLIRVRDCHAYLAQGAIDGGTRL